MAARRVQAPVPSLQLPSAVLLSPPFPVELTTKTASGTVNATDGARWLRSKPFAEVGGFFKNTRSSKPSLFKRIGMAATTAPSASNVAEMRKEFGVPPSGGVGFGPAFPPEGGSPNSCAALRT